LFLVASGSHPFEFFFFLLLQEEPFYGSLRLIIIDCLSTILAPLVGRNPKGHAIMVSVIRALKALATRYRIAILVRSVGS
jgi:hypothetical protein